MSILLIFIDIRLIDIIIEWMDINPDMRVLLDKKNIIWDDKKKFKE